MKHLQNLAKQFISKKKIKGWSRIKKAALITGNFDKLPLLAECKNETTHKNNTKGSDSDQPDKD